uniref:Uncharacterized protein n=1 Tax=Arundo donax TaxID=35708 RepID=A0A0A9G143_ARUDO
MQSSPMGEPHLCLGIKRTLNNTCDLAGHMEAGVGKECKDQDKCLVGS